MRIKKATLFLFLLFSVSCFSQTWGIVGGGVYEAGGGWIDDMDVFQNKLYVCGGFLTAGNIHANYIASWSNGKWDSLSSGTSPGMPSRLTHSDTMLYAGGSFVSAGGVANTYRLARWDGSQWFSVNSNYPSNDQIYALKFYNDFYAGGNFNQVGSLNVNRIAKWNGTNWSNMSGGVTGGFIPQINCMAVYNGDLYVGGDFTFAGGKSANYIARWNGAIWDSVVSGFDNTAAVMFVDATNNLLYVSGAFTTAGGTPITQGFAKWNGTTWSNVGLPAVNSAPASFALYRGKIFMGYYSSTGSIVDTVFASWDGATWKRIEGPNNGVVSLRVYNDTLYLGGYFDRVYDSTKGWLATNYIAKYWEPLSGVNELNQSLKFNLYPNPAKSEININVEGGENKKYFARIYNDIGEKIIEQKFSKQIKISTSSLSKGIYQVQVCNSDGKICHTEKIVVQ